MKRKNKTVLSVKIDNQGSDNKYFDMNNIEIKIAKGTTGAEMGYALCAVLSVVIAKENEAGNKFTVDSFLHYLGMLMKDSAIGLPKEAINDK